MIVGVQWLDMAYQVRPKSAYMRQSLFSLARAKDGMVHAPPDVKMVQLVPVSALVGTGVAQTVPYDQLSIEHSRERAIAVQSACPIIAVVSVDTFLELILVDQREHLGKNVITI